MRNATDSNELIFMIIFIVRGWSVTDRPLSLMMTVGQAYLIEVEHIAALSMPVCFIGNKVNNRELLILLISDY